MLIVALDSPRPNSVLSVDFETHFQIVVGTCALGTWISSEEVGYSMSSDILTKWHAIIIRFGEGGYPQRELILDTTNNRMGKSPGKRWCLFQKLP